MNAGRPSDSRGWRVPFTQIRTGRRLRPPRVLALGPDQTRMPGARLSTGRVAGLLAGVDPTVRPRVHRSTRPSVLRSRWRRVVAPVAGSANGGGRRRRGRDRGGRTVIAVAMRLAGPAGGRGRCAELLDTLSGCVGGGRNIPGGDGVARGLGAVAEGGAQPVTGRSGGLGSVGFVRVGSHGDAGRLGGDGAGRLVGARGGVPSGRRGGCPSGRRGGCTSGGRRYLRRRRCGIGGRRCRRHREHTRRSSSTGHAYQCCRPDRYQLGHKWSTDHVPLPSLGPVSSARRSHEDGSRQLR